ncbi:DUF6163 family protein [Consotaella aegiceratis]|uniref:DUF6163 family protein n=1 Tax=Consotaella aegiceratis TaxID=3097961 RepID=UPI002F3FC83C
MTIDLRTRDKADALNRSLISGLKRIFGLLLFAGGVHYWTRLVGIYDGDLWRFDLMPFWWKVAAPALAVFYPVAGIGLWTMMSWGPVVWFGVALAEAVMHVGFPKLFGPDLLWLGLHCFGLAMLVVLRLVDRIEAATRLKRLRSSIPRIKQKR